MSWLRRFGQGLLKNPAANAERAQQMIQLAAVGMGVLSTLSGEIGEQHSHLQQRHFLGKSGRYEEVIAAFDAGRWPKDSFPAIDCPKF